MMRTTGFAVLGALVLACGGGAGGKKQLENGGTGAGGGEAGGCPRELDVRVAWMQQQGWELHEVLLPWDNHDFFAEDAEPAEKDIDEATARKYGARSTDDPVWLFVDDDAPPCAATPGGWVVSWGGDGMYHTRIFRRLSGCTPAKDDEKLRQVVYALQQPGGEACRWAGPASVSLRLDEETKGELPPALAAKMPMCGAACAPGGTPGMVEKWTAQVIAVPGGPKYYEVLHSTISEDGVPEHECSWPVDSWFARFAEPAGGGALVDWPGEEGWHVGVFYAGSEARVLVVEELGRYWLIPPGAGGAAPQAPHEDQAIDWWIPHEEDFPVKSLGPYCGP